MIQCYQGGAQIESLLSMRDPTDSEYMQAARHNHFTK